MFWYWNIELKADSVKWFLRVSIIVQSNYQVCVQGCRRYVFSISSKLGG